VLASTRDQRDATKYRFDPQRIAAEWDYLSRAPLIGDERAPGLAAIARKLRNIPDK